jgi:WD40 repeat protein
VHDSDILLLSCVAGFKERDPQLSYVRLDTDTGWDGTPEAETIQNGLLDIIHHLALDPTRKLIYAADDRRVKSYTYDGDKHKPKHTMNSKRSGPLALTNDGSRILRAGKGGVDIWNVDTLPDHGPKGTKRIGRGKINLEDSWRDPDDLDNEVELSTGTPSASTIEFTDQTLNISKWHLPENWNTGGVLKALCTEDKKRVSVLSLDLQAGGKIASRYLGHGGEVNTFDSSIEDPNSFVTAASDGYVRLFDVRTPVPGLTINVERSSAPCYSTCYVYINGIPVIFTGGIRSQAIRVWDPRVGSRSVLYKLATGNNVVNALAWDSKWSTLYAATECESMDRLGFTHGYRSAKIRHEEEAKDGRVVQGAEGAAAAATTSGPPGASGVKEVKMDGGGEDDSDDEDNNGEDDSDEFDEEKCWPEKSFHNEQHFGYAFDCGDHRLLRYRFGLDADAKKVPVYGQAQLERDDYW